MPHAFQWHIWASDLRPLSWDPKDVVPDSGSGTHPLRLGLSRVCVSRRETACEAVPLRTAWGVSSSMEWPLLRRRRKPQNMPQAQESWSLRWFLGPDFQCRAPLSGSTAFPNSYPKSQMYSLSSTWQKHVLLLLLRWVDVVGFLPLCQQPAQKWSWPQCPKKTSRYGFGRWLACLPHTVSFLEGILPSWSPLVSSRSRASQVAANTGIAGDAGSIPGSGRSPRGGNGNGLWWYMDSSKHCYIHAALWLHQNRETLREMTGRRWEAGKKRNSPRATA